MDWHKGKMGGERARCAAAFPEEAALGGGLRLLSCLEKASASILISDIVSWLPGQVPQLSGTDPSPCAHRISVFHLGPQDTLGQIFDMDLYRTLPWAPRLWLVPPGFLSADRLMSTP